jgi:hypothetical protein
MLKTKIELPYIGVFKLNSGEEFIGKVIEDNITSYVISKPLTIVQVPGQGPQFAPLVMMADADKPITVPKPIIAALPSAALESQYESITSGIALPQKSSIIS